MSTFCAVNDDALIALIRQAGRRIVYIGPGLYLPVAKALSDRFDEIGKLEVTLILDADEDVCRIGFGEIAALQEVHRQTQRAGFYVRYQPALRIGVLLADDRTLVWSPTPRSVEDAPETANPSASAVDKAPNGLFLGANPGEQIAQAVCAEGTDTHQRDAEIGTRAVSPERVAEVAKALADNPPIPVDLARVTRVFSTKLQFVELKVKGAKLARRQIRISSDLLNADASEQLRSLLDAKLRAFADFKDREIEVPMFVRGEPAFDKSSNPLLEPVSEATLSRERHAIESDFLYDIPGFGRLMERTRRAEFEARVEAYETRLMAHSEGMRKTIAREAEEIIRDTVNLIGERIARATASPGHTVIDRGKLADELHKTLSRVEDEAPTVNYVFKEVTYEQTQDEDFRKKLDRALPATVKRRLGNWYEKFSAAKQVQEANNEIQP
ncbi:hypothetical protein [Thiocapsa bogorovii]|uniref:hypothetical protein n=1 Tax=Thiocapsa bogorovii TaxID=521689 RepID=UPI001E46F989|nr:hypothetical protein [Thiocapsa bogorovii]UHD17388.1 hypothetical protein LT988_04885 [Thiocapsa bogorovii]